MKKYKKIMIKSFRCIPLFILATLFISCESNYDMYTPLLAEDNEQFSGGETTVFDRSDDAFGFFARNLDRDLEGDFGVGNSLFRQNWVTAPASTTARDGLGPFFNARACSTCHFKDGRGRAPQFNGEVGHGLLLRLSVPGTTSIGGNNPDPIYGSQLQDLSILGTTTEGNFDINYIETSITYPDGATASLRKPTYSFTNLAYGEMADNVHISPRVGNQIIGLGLLEAIPESTLIGLSDEFDSNQDGISGKPNYVWNIENQSTSIGRFGWKASQPSVKQQVASAFSGDLGITSSLFPDENCPTGVNCDDFINGGEPEIPNQNLDRVVIYSSTLAVPARRGYEEQNVLEGKQLFNDANCIACHTPKITTGNHPIAALSNQTIRPYTDLLLHDMGDGLADNTPDFNANGNEWRTQPLWGIGLIEIVNNHTNLLHDGRARNIEEAILWHGGEAEDSKVVFVNYTAEERQKLLDFIKSL